MIFKISLSLLLFFLTLPFLSAQTIDGVPMEKLNMEYIQIVGTSKVFKNKMIVTVDYGQNSRQQGVIKEQNGKKMEFNSMIDALNFFTEYGYAFENAYAITVSGSNVYHYILRKDFVEEEK